MRWRCAIKHSTHSQIIYACVSKSSGPRCEIVDRVGRRWIVHLSSCTHGFCVAPAPVQHCYAARAILGYCDHGVRANLLGVSVANEGVCLTNTLPLHVQTCLATRESMAKRPPGTTGVGLLPRSNTRRTAALVEVSGPPAVTSLRRKLVSPVGGQQGQWSDDRK